MKRLKTILDFWRYGVTEANRAHLWYGHGTDNAVDDILALIVGTLHLSFDGIEQWLPARLTEAESDHLLNQLKKRITDQIPVPYLTHEAYFCGRSYYVDERVLIPRSPIAELIEQQFSPWIQAEAVTRVLDLCTGSGCLAIACADAFPEARVDAVDVSPEALAVAQINVERHHMAAQVHLIQSDLWQQVPSVRYDVIVSNPPYVSTTEMKTLPVEYRHEPTLALVAGDTGLACVAEILAQAKRFLSPQGILVVEVGNSEETVIETYPNLPFTWLDFERGGHGVFLLTAEQL